jgi:tetratricopeptide (TPR) repeat protein
MSVAKSIHPNARGPLRLDRAIQIIDQRLESEPLILDALIASLVRGQPQRQVWDNLHLAAARDGRVGELSAAYEQLLQSTRLKLLAAPVLAEVLTRAGAFFEDVAADPGRAIELLHRALSSAPAHGEAFTRLEALLGAQGNTVALIDLYASASSHCPGLQEQLSFLRRAADLASSLPDESDQAIKVYQQIVRLDPGDHATARALEERYVGAGRPRDAAKLLEQIVGGHSALPADEDTAIRERLLALYSDLQERERTIPHVERLLAQEPSHFAAREAAESLLSHRALASRAAAALGRR